MLKSRRRVERVYLEWGSGGEGLILELRKDTLNIFFYNLNVTGEPNSLKLEGNKFQVKTGKWGRRRVVYISYPRLKLLPVGVKGSLKTLSSKFGYKVYVARLPFENYLTIVTPSKWKYEWFVVSTDLTCVVCNSRVYYEGLKNTLTLYFV